MGLLDTSTESPGAGGDLAVRRRPGAPPVVVQLIALMVGWIGYWAGRRTVAAVEAPLPPGSARFEFAMDARWPACPTCKAWTLPVTVVIQTGGAAVGMGIAFVCPERHVTTLEPNRGTAQP